MSRPHADGKTCDSVDYSTINASIARIMSLQYRFMTMRRAMDRPPVRRRDAGLAHRKVGR